MYPSAAICLPYVLLHTNRPGGICGQILMVLGTVQPTTILNLLPKLLTPAAFPDKLWLPQTDRHTDALFYCVDYQWRFVVPANGRAGVRIIT
jgi:hypothetical protein